MKVVFTTFNEYLEKQNQIYFSFLALPLVLYPVVYLPLKDYTVNTSGDTTKDWIYYFAAGVLFAIGYLGWRLYKKNITQIDLNWPLEAKLSRYKSTSMALYGFGLVLSLVSIGLLWLTKHQLFVAVYPTLLLLISFYRPTARRMEKELPLSDQELNMIKNKRKKS